MFVGINGTIFAYGQTASGKTYTMLGCSSEPGVITLAVEELFQHIQQVSLPVCEVISPVYLYKSRWSKWRQLLRFVAVGGPQPPTFRTFCKNIGHHFCFYIILFRNFSRHFFMLLMCELFAYINHQ